MTAAILRVSIPIASPILPPSFCELFGKPPPTQEAALVPGTAEIAKRRGLRLSSGAFRIIRKAFGLRCVFGRFPYESCFAHKLANRCSTEGRPRQSSAGRDFFLVSSLLPWA